MVSDTELRTLMGILDKLSKQGVRGNQDLTYRVSELKYTLVSEFGNLIWEDDENFTEKDSAIVDSPQLAYFALYKKVESLGNKLQEVAKIISKVERVIPLLLRAMETTDDLDLLEAAIDLLEVHLAKLAELTK